MSLDVAEDEALRLAASLQTGSEHPLARAVLAAARERGLPLAAPQDVQALLGQGVQGQVEGQTLLLGSVPWLHGLGVDLQEAASALRQLHPGATLSALARRVEGGAPLEALALLDFGDEPKPGAQAALAQLRAQGIRCLMLSGDNPDAAHAMARRLGLQPENGEVLAGVLPEGKAQEVKRLALSVERPSLNAKRRTRNAQTVAMVGDGFNDAPALAAADVGIAMGGGADAALHAAGITLMRGDPLLVPAALDVARRTVAKIRQNLFWAFIYNVAGIPLAALGYLNPMLAGAAMALSSVSVMSNALLLARWRAGTHG
jgi:Cu+-exporting ATPase